MGRKLFIVTNGYELIHKSAIRRGWRLSERPREDFPLTSVTEHRGILNSSGSAWQRQRKFIHDRLKQFGFGKTSFESKILTEVSSFIEYLRFTNGQPCDIIETVQTSMANVVFSIVCGKRHEYTDTVFRTILRNINYTVKVFFTYSMVLDCVPLPNYVNDWIPFDILRVKQLKGKRKLFQNYVKELYDKHMGEINDLMDSYIKEEKEIQNNETRADYSFHQLYRVMDDLLGAGSETSSSAIPRSETTSTNWHQQGCSRR